MAGAGALLTLVAFTFGASALLVPGLAFLLIGLVAPALVWLPARGATVSRELSVHEVVEDERFTSRVSVRAGRLGLLGAELHDPLGREAILVRMAPSLHGRELSLEVNTSFARRGLKNLQPPELRVADPLSLFIVSARARTGTEVVVLPSTRPVHWRVRGGGGPRLTPEHGMAADALASSEVDGLRPYRPGTPASRIHWGALARGAGLLERRMSSEQDSRPLVVLDSRCPMEQLELLDQAVRAAASLVLELARRGGCGLLTAETVRPLEVDERLSAWPAAHTRLALIGPAQRPPAFAGRRRPGSIVYVAALPMSRPPQTLSETGGILVLPTSLPAPGRCPVVLEVAGCLGYSLTGRGRQQRAPEPAAVAP